ncbi:MAG: ATP-binding protein [Cyanobacteria bacterium SZAS LIN-2]|nr:ATP-binding protein [Cyanobacteria bacterium SZAS LIN-2]
MSKRIIVVGASGVGKTTLVEALAPLLNLPVIPELGRKLCLDMGYQRIGDIPATEQENFKRLVLEAQIEQENSLGEFIADRSTIDCWVLWQRWNICSAMTYDTEAYYTMAREQAKDYSHVIYLPPMFAPPEDGFRWTDLDYQKEIDRLVRMTLFEWDHLPHTLTVQSTGHDERVQETMAWLSQ